MGDTTAISWTDGGATFNPWIGCSKVSQGCRFCYAESQNKRYGWTSAWGPGAPRKRTSEANWKKPLAWAREAVKAGITRRVFCASLADVFDAEVEQAWRDDLWALMMDCSKIGGLEWLVLTKRPENIIPFIYGPWLANPPEWLRIGVTAEDQKNTDKRIPELLRAWRGKNFISYEPAIGPVDFTEYLVSELPVYQVRDGFLVSTGETRRLHPLHWIIVGGESGPGCRPMDLEWARAVRDQCKAAGVPFFMKQLGGHPNKRHDPAEWPSDLRVQEFPWGAK